MKYYFFVNPAAGQGKGDAEFIRAIENVAAEAGCLADTEIIKTNAVGDGERKARELAAALAGEAGRFYACGGDGTANEVINGTADFPNTAVGIIPIGTGNDAVRNYPEAGDYLNLKAQLAGRTKKIDLIRYSGLIDGRQQTRYCVNMINIGFDCNVVELAGRLKRKPLIAGSAAYLLAVLGMFIQMKGISLRVIEDGETRREGKMLLCALCNGSYCGGGIKTAPQAKVNDGVFDINIVNEVSRGTFLRFFPKFSKGEHEGLPGVEKIVNTWPSRGAEFLPYDTEDFFICVDGEICLTTGIRAEICPEALNIIVPLEPGNEM